MRTRAHARSCTPRVCRVSHTSKLDRPQVNIDTAKELEKMVDKKDKVLCALCCTASIRDRTLAVAAILHPQSFQSPYHHRLQVTGPLALAVTLALVIQFLNGYNCSVLNAPAAVVFPGHRYVFARSFLHRRQLFLLLGSRTYVSSHRHQQHLAVGARRGWFCDR